MQDRVTSHLWNASVNSEISSDHTHDAQLAATRQLASAMDTTCALLEQRLAVSEQRGKTAETQLVELRTDLRQARTENIELQRETAAMGEQLEASRYREHAGQAEAEKAVKEAALWRHQLDAGTQQARQLREEERFKLQESEKEVRACVRCIIGWFVGDGKFNVIACTNWIDCFGYCVTMLTVSSAGAWLVV